MERDLFEAWTTETAIPETPWGMLPPRLRVLFVCEKSKVGSWIAGSLSNDAICKVHVCEAANPLLALERLREETFDAVVVAQEGVQTLDWIEAIRVGSSAVQPILVLGSVADREFSALCFESGADAFLTVDSITNRELIWHLARAAERRRLMEENERNRVAEQRRRNQEHDEVLRVLADQKTILGLDSADAIPNWLLIRTHELLSTYVVMGTGQLAGEMDRFLSTIVDARVAQATVVKAFHEAIGRMVAELGNRSARHILNRGNVLMLETLLHVSKRYDDDRFSFSPSEPNLGTE
ncbi:MAG: hypothetical protein KDB27_01790 [Planctomycetales bacterium]|nr:hypothetical protein [Planctomycetales bacterium]